MTGVMHIDLLRNIASALPRGRALLGLDVGAKTIGLAVCDPGLSVATPLRTIKRTKFSADVQELLKAVKEFEIGGFVVGLPVSMDGSEGRRAQSVRDFARELGVRLRDHEFFVESGVWIALWDERLSTASVEDLVDNSVEKRKTKAKAKDSGLIDRLAAQHILQGALEYLNRQ